MFSGVPWLELVSGKTALKLDWKVQVVEAGRGVSAFRCFCCDHLLAVGVHKPGEEGFF